MTLVTINGTRPVTVDCDVEATWVATGAQELGSARIRIPRHSTAWNRETLDEDGGFLVTVHSPAGRWTGVADTPVWSAAGCEVPVQHIMAWAKIRAVRAGRRFRGVTAGAVVRRAVTDALVGLGSVPVTLGAIMEAAPLVSYDFTGQPLLTVLSDMQAATGHVWLIDDQGRFHWRVQTGRYHEVILIDDGRYVDKLSRTPLADQVAEWIDVYPSGRTDTARDHGAPPLWPQQRIVRV